MTAQVRRCVRKKGARRAAGAQKLLDGVADAYGIALGLLGTCCLAQFIAIVASLTVAGT